MKGSSNDNGKVYDSGYANTSVSHSQMRSSRDSSSLGRKNTNQSDSGGISGGTALSSDLRNYALPQPIKRRKNKDGHKTTQSEPSTGASTGNVNTQPRSWIKFGRENDAGTYDSNGSSPDFATRRKKREEIDDVELADDIELEEHNGDTNSTELERGIGMITNPLEDTTSNINATFSAIISMKNGLIVEVTPSLSATLGYTRESWINRSFIDFVHPKDKQTFADHLAKTIVLPYGGRDKGLHGHPKHVFCSLRENREQKSSVGSENDERSSCVTTSNLYVPFDLKTSIKVFRELTGSDKLQMMFLVVRAEPIMPIYKVPEAMILSRMFSTRHDCNCILTHVEVDVVQYFGYMPQDMIGRSLFDFYHPDDLPLLKGVYETVVKTEGLPFRSTPYRFVTQNGDYVLMETKWSAFFNPWIEKIEFVVGLHKVLRGPTNPNVFQAPSDRQRSLLANISKESEIIQNEIRAILNEKYQRTEDHDVCEITSSSLNLDKFVKNLLRKVMPPAPVSKKHITSEDKSFLKLDTAMKGAKSPDRDSNSCTESPPSYGQLNFIDKITRYFDSNLVINKAYGTYEDNMNPSVPSNKNDSKPISNSTDESHTENGLITGTKKSTLNGEDLSSGSNNRTSCDSRDDNDNLNNTNATPVIDLKLPTLTESVLKKHNSEMENLFLQQPKKRQCKNQNIKNNKDSKNNDSADKPSKNQAKASSPKKRKADEHCEGEQCKIPKYDESARTHIVPSVLGTTNAPVNSEDKTTLEKALTQNVNSRPPVTLPVPSQPLRSHFYMAAPSNGRRTESQYPVLSPLVPVYCVPVPPIHNHIVPTVAPIANQSPHVTQSPQLTYVSYTPAALASVIYPPILCDPEPVTRMYDQFLIPRPAPIHQETAQTNFANARQENLSESIERPASQATSIKAEIGSSMALSEDTKKQVFLGERLSSCISIGGVCSSLLPNTNREIDTNNQLNSSLEDSSDSSFYSSFLSTNSETGYDQNEKSVAQHQQSTLPNCMGFGEMQIDQLSRGPPWQESIEITDQLKYRYQLTRKPLNEVLEADMEFLRQVTQPSMVRDQVAQMCSDIGLSKVDFLAKLMSCGVDASMNSEGENSAIDQLNTPVELNNIIMEGHQ